MTKHLPEDIEVYKVDALNEVYQDIEQLALWYRETAGDVSAIKFRHAINLTLQSLQLFPRIHTTWEDADTVRRIDMPTHNVALIYRIDDDELEVIAVAAFHTLQDSSTAKQLITERLRLAKEQFGHETHGAEKESE